MRDLDGMRRDGMGTRWDGEMGCEVRDGMQKGIDSRAAAAAFEERRRLD